SRTAALIDRKAFVSCCALLVVVAAYQAVVVPLDRARRTTIRQDFDTFYYMAKAVHWHGHSALDHAYLRRLADQETGAGTIVVVTQPPFSLVPFVPLTYLPLERARVVWHGLCLATLAGVFLVLHRASTSARLPLTAGAFVLVVALFQPLHHHFRNGQTNLLMLLLMASAVTLERSRWRSRDALAGFLLGFAIVSKIFPALVVPLFLVRGRWRAVAWTLLAIITLTVVALPITGWLDYLRYPEHLSASYYFGAGSDVSWNLSLKRYWMRFLDATTAPPLESVLRPAYALPLAWVFFQAWRERRSSATSFELRFWQACLLMTTVMASYWEYHMVFALGAYSLIADDAIGRRTLSPRMVAATALCFLACCVPTRTLLDVSVMGVPALAWLRCSSSLLLAFILEWMALRLARQERTAAIALRHAREPHRQVVDIG
ncbi:MAG: glycosyltransferase family 87 protein, partial [Candidatus Binatia bacterium]